MERRSNCSSNDSGRPKSQDEDVGDDFGLFRGVLVGAAFMAALAFLTYLGWRIIHG